MSEPRWTVRWHRGTGWIDPSGWVVCDRHKRVSISWPNYGESLQHKDRIAFLYARFGW